MADISSLNKSYGIEGRITVYEGAAQLPWIRLQCDEALVEVCLQGAHVSSYRPGGTENILWVSSTSSYQEHKAIRGGIPICWPWFGANPENSERPQHGYARNSLFTLTSSAASETEVQVILKLNPDEVPFSEWVGALQLEVEIRLSDQLWIEMRTRNLSDRPIQISDALHSYFSVSDVRHIQVPELLGCSYLDKTHSYQRLNQENPFGVVAEVDRVYLDVEKRLELVDSKVSKKIRIETWGNRNLVVWNPWIEHARKMDDFEDHGYLNMLCLEPANAQPNSVDLKPGTLHRLGQCIKMKT